MMRVLWVTGWASDSGTLSTTSARRYRRGLTVRDIRDRYSTHQQAPSWTWTGWVPPCRFGDREWSLGKGM